MIIGYARVSTTRQDLDAQLEMLEKNKCDEIFQEKITGISKDRPMFNEMLKHLKSGDTLIVTKLDRMARSTIDGIGIIKLLFEMNVTVRVLNMGTIENSPTGRLTFNILMSIAEFERDMIIERTKEGKRLALMRGDFIDGRPIKFKKKQLEHAAELKQSRSYRQVTEMTGISKSTLYRFMLKKEKEKIEGKKINEK